MSHCGGRHYNLIQNTLGMTKTMEIHTKKPQVQFVPFGTIKSTAVIVYPEMKSDENGDEIMPYSIVRTTTAQN